MSRPAPRPRRYLQVASAALTTATAGLLVVQLLAPQVPAAAAPGVTVAGSTAQPARTAASPVALAIPAPARTAAAAAAVVGADLEQVLTTQRAAGLTCSTSSRGLPVCVHGGDQPSPTAADSDGPAEVEGSGSSTTGSSSAPIGCYGDGTSGRRIRAVYARPQGSTSQYAATAPKIRAWAASMDSQVDRSAQRTGGRRHLRFATTAGSSCSLLVLDVVLPASAFASFPATIDALESRGINLPTSKYLVWADASGYCGIGQTYYDDSPAADNLNNGGLTMYARVDRTCWGRSETHELVHMLGGVQQSAPHATKGLHCNDGVDVMCYDDRTAGSTQRSVCSSSDLLDCRNDDYFSTAPAKGSYLQTHWNTARSSFLTTTLQDPAPASASPRPSSSPSPSSSPKPSASPAPSASPSTNGVPGLLAKLPTVPALPLTRAAVTPLQAPQPPALAPVTSPLGTPLTATALAPLGARS